MGKIIRFDSTRVIKDAENRAQTRNYDAVARLDRRLAEMDAAYEARKRNNRAPPRQTVRKSQAARTRIWNPSGTTIFNIGMLAFIAFWFAPDYMGYTAQPTALASSSDAEAASFSFCHYGGGTNCVVDGDTIWYQGNVIRIADIDTPETHPPRCAREAQLGKAATDKLQSLLNAGTFSIENIDRDTDRYGRQLRVLTRGGESIGGMLVDDGLARWYTGGRQPWC